MNVIAPLSLDGSIDKRLRYVVDRMPDQPAFVSSNQATSYREFDTHVNRVAHCVTQRLGGSRGPVAVTMSSGVLQAAVLFGLFRANAIRIQIDAGTPLERLRRIVRDVGATVLVSDMPISGAGQEKLPGVSLIGIEEILASPGDQFPLLEIDDDAPLVLAPTSGTTGGAKVIVHTNPSTLWGFRNYASTTVMSASDRVGVLSNRALDLVGALLSGAAVSFYDFALQGAVPLPDWLRACRITVLPTAPSILRSILKYFLAKGTTHELRLIRSTGEPLRPRDVINIERAFGDDCVLVNWMASSESIVAVARARCGDNAALQRIDRGEAIDDLEVSVVDPRGVAVPHGETGEIVVSGRYLFAGYWNQPELSASVLQAHPSRPGLKSFRTGDRGRFDSKGRIELMGRKDDVIKVQGNRIEASEVESALRDLPGVHDAAAVTWTDESGEQVLVSYLEADANALPSVREARRCLDRVLPRYMIPSFFVLVEQLPRGPTGKVMRGRLRGLPHGRRDQYNAAPEGK